MRKLSPATRKGLEEDPRMKRCVLCDRGGCGGRIEWHHALQFANRQSDDPKHILGVCSTHHDMARHRDVKESLDLAMLRLLSKEEIDDISKAIDYHQRLKYLENKYGST